MKSFCIIALALIACAAAETYTTENDDLDIQSVAANPIELKAFADCFSDKGGCTAVTSAFKVDMSEAIQQACAKCTPEQKNMFKVFLKALKEKLPAEYEVYRTKYDHDNKYFPALEAAVAR